MSDWTIIVSTQTDDPHHARTIILQALRLANISARTTTVLTHNYEANLNPRSKPLPVARVFVPEHQESAHRSPHRKRR